MQQGASGRVAVGLVLRLLMEPRKEWLRGPRRPGFQVVPPNALGPGWALRGLAVLEGWWAGPQGAEALRARLRRAAPKGRPANRWALRLRAIEGPTAEGALAGSARAAQEGAVPRPRWRLKPAQQGASGRLIVGLDLRLLIERMTEWLRRPRMPGFQLVLSNAPGLGWAPRGLAVLEGWWAGLHGAGAPQVRL